MASLERPDARLTRYTVGGGFGTRLPGGQRLAEGRSGVAGLVVVTLPPLLYVHWRTVNKCMIGREAAAGPPLHDRQPVQMRGAGGLPSALQGHSRQS